MSLHCSKCDSGTCKHVVKAMATRAGLGGTSSGMHMHAGKDIPAPIRDYSGKFIDRQDVVDEWAREVLTIENDMIYLRLKDGVIQWIRGNDRGIAGGPAKWTQLRMSDVPKVAKAEVEETEADKELKRLAAEKEEALTKAPVGWYQDTAGALYKHLGKGEWDCDSNNQRKNLNSALLDNALEYLG